ncbi:MAG TPA: sulfatase/phosphatase domain-containing protein, partial [Balneolales bacterium]|nr:sulfatase/phosphatase domain-containing protein [Balneolales bacterium]
WRERMYYHYYEYGSPHWVRPHYGIKTNKHKLIYYYSVDEWEMFDLNNDPYELKSVYDDKKYQSVIGQLKTDLRNLRIKYDDHTGKSI